MWLALSDFNNFWQKHSFEIKQSKPGLFSPAYLADASALHGKTMKHRVSMFSLKCCIAALPPDVN